jgi:phosphate transport system protein
MTHLDHELDELRQKLLLMASRAEQSVERATQGLAQRNSDLASRIKEEDKAIDQLEIEIDDLAIRLLAKAPLAQQLRLITVAMKISRDLERVGDEATTIARRALQLNAEAPLEHCIDIPRIAELALAMLRDAIHSFVHADRVLARAVIPRDKLVDALNKQAHHVLGALMMEEPAAISRCLHLMVVSKSLERVGDHAKNIAEEVVFLFEGHDIRHQMPQTGAAPAADLPSTAPQTPSTSP